MTQFLQMDFSEIDQLSVDLGSVPSIAGRKIRQATEISARNVKDAWAKKLEGEPHAPHASRSITYDVSAFQGFGSSVINAEIGPETGRLQAPIVVVLEFGAPGNNTAPHGYGAGALLETAPDFEEGLIRATADAEREALNSTGAVRAAGSVIRGSYL